MFARPFLCCYAAPMDEWYMLVHDCRAGDKCMILSGSHEWVSTNGNRRDDAAQRWMMMDEQQCWDGRKDGRTDGQTDGRTEGRTDGRTD